MSARAINAKWTAPREGHLERLVADPKAGRKRGPVGFHCMKLGWTQWRWTAPIGDPQRRTDGEELTDAGHAVLARWRNGDRS